MREQRTRSGLIVMSDSHHEEVRPLQCGVCGTRFRKDQLGVFDRHVARCANTEAGLRMEAGSPRRVWPMFDPALHGDQEHGAWVRRNRKALAEGWMKM